MILILVMVATITVPAGVRAVTITVPVRVHTVVHVKIPVMVATITVQIQALGTIIIIRGITIARVLITATAIKRSYLQSNPPKKEWGPTILTYIIQVMVVMVATNNVPVRVQAVTVGMISSHLSNPPKKEWT